MTLVDTSVWVKHLRAGDSRLEQLLGEGEVLCHPFVAGELACGHLRGRGSVLGLLAALPQAQVAAPGEVLGLVERHRLWGRGLGWIDVHLLAAALLDASSFWSLDRRLSAAARAVGLS